MTEMVNHLKPCLLTSIALVCGMLLAGCGATTNAGGGSGGGTGSGGTSTPLYLPPGNTQRWVKQIENQTLPADCTTPSSCWPTNQVSAVATDRLGNFIIVGETLTEMPGVVDYQPNYGIFITKYDTNGNLLWILQTGPASSTGFANISSVSTDTSGNIYAGGYTTGAFPGNTNPDNEYNLLLLKIDPNGNMLYAQQYNTDLYLFNVLGASMALVPSGQIVFGWISDATSGGTGYQSFLYVINPDTAQKIWQKSYAGSNEMTAMTSDSQGNLVIVGESLGNFPGVESATTINPFAVKLNGTNGDILWQQVFTSEVPTPQTILGFFGIAADGNNDILIGGATTTNSVGLCTGICNEANLPYIYEQSAIVAKLNGQTGNVMWFKDFNTGLGDGVTGIAVDANNNAFAVGFTNGSMADGFTQPTDDLFALKIDTNANVLWAQQFGTGPGKSLSLIGIQAATDFSGNLLVGGETTGAFPGNTNPTGLGEAFVIKFGP
jgi:hypothetical protein